MSFVAISIESKGIKVLKQPKEAMQTGFDGGPPDKLP